MALLTRFYRNESGVAFMEFAFALPLFLILLMGVIETTNFVYANQKAESAATNILNIITLQNEVSTAQLADMSSMLPEIIRPFEVSLDEYKVIVTTMERPLGVPFGYVRWQKEFGGAPGDSKFDFVDGGTRAENKVKPAQVNNFAFVPGDQIVYVESYFHYTPVLDVQLMRDILGLENDSYLYHVTAPARPRANTLRRDPDDAG